MDRTLRLILLVSVLIQGSVNRTRTAALQAVPTITVVDRNNNPTNLITDGNLVSLRLNNLKSIPSGTKLEYWLEGVEQPVASCSFTQAGQSCLSGQSTQPAGIGTPLATQRQIAAWRPGSPMGRF